MFPSKSFFSNISIPDVRNSYSSSNSRFSNFALTNIEMYPRRRQTEFYYDPQPLEEYQSRVSEHPGDKLRQRGRSKMSMYAVNEVQPPTRINPPRNSDMRMFRNSYFS